MVGFKRFEIFLEGRGIFSELGNLLLECFDSL